MAETCNYILYIATNYNIVVFLTVCYKKIYIYIYIHYGFVLLPQSLTGVDPYKLILRHLMTVLKLLR